MDIEGTEIISAPREKVWAFVTDAESMASCTPGVKSFRILEPDKRFEVVGGVKLGTVGSTPRRSSSSPISWNSRRPG